MEVNVPRFLSERQQATVSAAITIVAAVVIVLAVLGLFWVIGLFLIRFSSVFMPVAVAGVAALVLKPYYEWLWRKVKYQWLAITLVFLSVLLPVAGFFVFFGNVISNQIGGLVEKGPELRQKLDYEINARLPQVQKFLEEDPWGQKVKAAIEENTEGLMEGARNFGRTLFSAGAGMIGWIFGLLGWFVVPIYFTFFLLMEPSAVRFDHHLPFLKEQTRKDVVYLVHEFVGIVVSFFRGQLVIAFLGGLMYAVAFSIAGLKYGFVIGLVLGFLNLIPYLGVMIGLAVGLPTAMFQEGGGIAMVAWVLLGFLVVQLLEGYILIPKIMGDRTGLHPMVIMIALFFWGSALGGIFGMILAIPLTAFLVVLWRLAREKYMSELV
jgi:predicted PurR-regulated permease PerM